MAIKVKQNSKSKVIAKNVSELRDIALRSLDDLRSGKIDVVEAGVTAKLCETIISSLKTEMDYHKMLENKPIIKFLEGAETQKNHSNDTKLLK